MSGDGLRDELVEAMIESAEAMTGFPIEKRQIEELVEFADAVLPVVQARVDAAEQAVQRVRKVLARWEYTPGRMAHVDVIRRALDGAP